MFLKIRNGFNKTALKVTRFLSKNFSIIMYSGITLVFVSLLIVLVFYQRMSEVDTALKYVLFPIYLFSALFSGRIAKNKIKQRLIILLKREPESRWAETFEIKKKDYIQKIHTADEKYDAGGIPFVVEKENIYVDNSEAHSLIIGSTGSGKTRRLVLPLLNILARSGQSVIATDPKGELYCKTSKLYEDLGYRVIAINLRDPAKGNAWNPLHIPYAFYKQEDIDKAVELVYDLGLNIFFDNTSGNKDPFWERSAANYFSGLVLSLFEDAKENEINLNSVISMSAKGMERLGVGNNTYIKEYFKQKNKSSIAYTSASGTVNAPNDTQASILSVFIEKLTTFSSKNELSKMLAYSDFDMHEIGVKKTIVYMIMQDEKSTYHPLVSAFIKQCYEVLIGSAQKHNGTLPIRTNFVLDEFANLPPISDISNMITAARSRNIRINLIIQGSEQLSAQYGKETAEVIKSNCTNWYFLISKELQLLKEISELCGNTEHKMGLGEYREKPLISISKLQRLEMGEILIRRDREHPYKTFFPDISEYVDWFSRDKTDGTINNRDDVKVFDLQAFLKKDKPSENIGENIVKTPQSHAGTTIRDNTATPVDVDEIMKKLDKQIAEIEAEEKRLAKQDKKKRRKKASKNKST